MTKLPWKTSTSAIEEGSTVKDKLHSEASKKAFTNFTISVAFDFYFNAF